MDTAQIGHKVASISGRPFLGQHLPDTSRSSAPWQSLAFRPCVCKQKQKTRANTIKLQRQDTVKIKEKRKQNEAAEAEVQSAPIKDPIIKEAREDGDGPLVLPDFTPLTNGNGPGRSWPKKADLYLVRTDGMSCSRETVKASGCLSFAHPSTQQQLLVWRGHPRCVMVLRKLGDMERESFPRILQSQGVMVLKKLGDEQREAFLRVLRFLGQEEDMRVIVEPHEYLKLSDEKDMDFVDTYNHAEGDKLHQHVDFVVCLGGDGTILHASSLFQRAIPPVISFSAGSLGFLTNHSLANVESDLRAVIYGSEDLDQCSLEEDPVEGGALIEVVTKSEDEDMQNVTEMRGVHITLRMRLECKIVRGKDQRNSGAKEERYEVMNEVVVDRGANPYLAKIECWERDTLITKVQADGVMLATPTGSTAYSVAAGGSMVHPNVPAMLFTPICPHSLSFRPVVLPDYAELELRIPADARAAAWVCFDGKQRQELHRGDAVQIRMSTNPVPTISKTDQTRDWFGSLERCFGWNDRAEQKPLSHVDNS